MLDSSLTHVCAYPLNNSLYLAAHVTVALCLSVSVCLSLSLCVSVCLSYEERVEGRGGRSLRYRAPDCRCNTVDSGEMTAEGRSSRAPYLATANLQLHETTVDFSSIPIVLSTHSIKTKMKLDLSRSTTKPFTPGASALEGESILVMLESIIPVTSETRFTPFPQLRHHISPARRQNLTFQKSRW